MEWQYVSIILSLALGIMGFLMKRSIEENDHKIEKLTRNQEQTGIDLQNMKQNYLHKDDFKEFKIELRQMVEEIKTDIRSLHK